MKRIILLCFAFGSFELLMAGSDELVKLGKITKEEMDMKVYEPDSSAGAVILKDIGTVDFVYNNSKERFEYTYTRKTRIKIFNANQFTQANQVINLYIGANERESLSKLKASTYNMEAGKLVESELKKDAIFKEDFDSRHAHVKFTMPNVKEGSILEYEYSINSPYTHSLPNWKFQHDIPVMRSTYSVDMPEFFTYRINTKGYLRIPQPYYESRSVSTYMSHREMNVGGSTTNYTGSLDYNMYSSTWTVLSAPAITEEPYISCIDNYISQIDMELAKVSFPHQPEEIFSLNWEGVIKQANEEENLGGQVNIPSMFLTKSFNTISDKAKTNTEKVNLAYDLIQHTMVWNGMYGKYSPYGIKDAFQKGKGNDADINLLLIRLLKDLGIESFPVILSTRDNGFVPDFPTVDGFNYLIAVAKVDGKNILLDATQKSLSPGVLPKRCLNGRGLVIKPNAIDWVDLNPSMAQNSVTSIDAKMLDNGKMEGKLSYIKKGYAAISLRNNTLDPNDREAYFKEIEKNNPGLTLKNKDLQNLDSIQLPTKEIYDFQLEGRTESNGDLVYLSPILVDKLAANPFRLKERQYPVDFTYPVEETYIVNLTLPQNYTIEEKPAPQSFALPDNNGKFSYMLNVVNGNSLQLTYKFSIKNTVFSQDQYADLKEFYTQVLKKLNEQLVLKKI